MTDSQSPKSSNGRLWVLAVTTIVVASVLPRLGEVFRGHDIHWSVREYVYRGGIALVAAVLFGTLVRWGTKAPSDSTRPAKAGLVCGILGILGVVLFYLSAPILFGGCAVALGLEGRARSKAAGAAGIATAGVILGTAAFLAGVAVWLFL